MTPKCQCCDTAEPGQPVKSKIKRGVSFYLCEYCESGKHEPRFWVILFGRANGVRSVETNVKLDRYCGERILAKELV